MKVKRALIVISILTATYFLSSAVFVSIKPSVYSENFPSVICPPTLSGLTSQVSLSSTNTLATSVSSKTMAMRKIGVLRSEIKRDALLLEAGSATPSIWQSRANSWAGGTICSAPSSSQWFVGGTSDVTSRGKLILVNSGLSSAIVDIKTWSESGEAMLKTVTVPAQRSVVFGLDTFAPGQKAIAINITPRLGRINSFVIDERGKGLSSLGGDFVNGTPAARKEIFIPAIPHQKIKKGSKNTKPHILRILNPGEVDANFSVEILSSDGRFVPVGFNSKLASSGKVSEFVINPNISTNAFAVRIASDSPVLAGVFSRVLIKGKKDFLWSTTAQEMRPFSISVTGLTPLLVFAGDWVAISVEMQFINGKKSKAKISGTDIATWRVPNNVASLTFINVSKATYGGALVSSVNGYGFIALSPGSALTKTSTPNSNIRILSP